MRLTDEEIKEIAAKYFFSHYWKLCNNFARAIEAALTKKQEPFGYFRPEPFGWTDCAETDEGAIALYEHPAPVNQQLLSAMKEIIANDGGEGSKCYNAIRLYDAREKARAAIAAAKGEK